MSYAEHIFNLKQNNVLNYADNLAMLGEDSYVYTNDSLMMALLESHIAKQNSMAALYMYMYCQENGLNVQDYFDLGDKIAFYHSDWQTFFEMELYAFTNDGHAYFTSYKCGLPLALSSAGGDYDKVAAYADYEINAYLNGKANWFAGWNYSEIDKTIDNPMTNPGQDVWLYMRKRPGFLSGISQHMKRLLRGLEDSKNPFYAMSYYDYQGSYFQGQKKPLWDTYTTVGNATRKIANELNANMAYNNGSMNNLPNNRVYWSALPMVPSAVDGADPKFRGSLSNDAGAVGVNRDGLVSASDVKLYNLNNVPNLNNIALINFRMCM